MILPLPYVPFGDPLVGVPHVFVDGLRAADTVLELSHWPGNRTPAHLRRDVSTQSVLALLGAPDAEALLAGARAVTCDHYDVDGLLATWALTDPERAVELREVATATALVGDFERYETAASVRACLALYCAEDEFAGELGVGSATTNEVTAALFTRMLTVTERCLREPARWQAGWAGRWHLIEESMRLLDAEPALLDEHVDAELAVLRTPGAVDPLAVHAHTERMLVARSTADGRHQLDFRYESFVDLQSATVPPRIRGDLLADELNAVELRGTWMCESPDTATPCLQLYSRSGAPSPSSLTFEEFVAALAAFCDRARADESLRWSPDGDWYLTAPVAPPSGWSS